MPLTKIKATVVAGHRIASGTSSKDKRFPEGSIAMQAPFFKQQGCDLAAYFGGDFFKGTVNVSVAPSVREIVKPEYFMKEIKWTDVYPPENFYLSPAELTFRGKTYKGMIYIPDPATKPDHFNPATVIDVIAPYIEGLAYGSEIEFGYNPDAIRLKKPAKL
jgi:hypothetical protein